MGGCPNKPRRSRPIYFRVWDLSGLSAATPENGSPWLIRGSRQPCTKLLESTGVRLSGAEEQPNIYQ